MNEASQKKHEESSLQKRPPAFGEDVALKGFTNQYLVAAELIYKALKESNFQKAILKDFTAEQVDDLVIVNDRSVDAYQVKWSAPPGTLTYGDFKTYIKQLYEAKGSLEKTYPEKLVTTHIYTSNIASHSSKIEDINPLSIFMQEYWSAEDISNSIASKWNPVVQELKKVLEIEQDIEPLRNNLKFILNRKRPEDREVFDPNDRYYKDIKTLADSLITLAGKKQGTIELEAKDIFDITGWHGRLDFKSRHVFETPSYYQPIESTVERLNAVISEKEQGYIALIGTPGSGKSTLLTQTLRYTPKIRVISYYCFIPNDPSVQQRSEAGNFLHDLVLSLKKHDIGTKNLTPGESLEQLRLDFESQLHDLAARYKEDGVKTIILIDGLDHIKRESNPERSLLQELPNPQAIPQGVLFVLGSQQIDQLDLKNLIQNQLKENNEDRTIEMDALTRRAIIEIVKSAIPNFDFEKENTDKIIEKSAGHPLALNYIINKLSEYGVAEELNEAIALLPLYEGNIENQYESYWKGFKEEPGVRELLAFLSRIRGYIDLNVIEEIAENEQDIAKLISVASHYFKKVSSSQWAFFHNSFRQFILEQTGRNAFGIENLEKNRAYHQKLADIALKQEDSSVFGWEVLYHTYHSGNYEESLEIAQQYYFRKQFLDGRCLDSIVEDLDLVMRAAKQKENPLSVIRVLLIYEELASRDYILDEINFPLLLLELGKTEEAVAYVFKEGKLLQREYKALEFSILLYDSGYKELAKKIFNAAEPIEKIEGTRHHYDLYAGEEILDVWLKAAARFRPASELANLISTFEADEPRHPAEDQEDKNKNLREYYYYLLVDAVVDLEDLEAIETLPSEMKGYLDQSAIKKRIALNILHSDHATTAQKEKSFNILKEEKGLKNFSSYESLLFCEFLLKRKGDEKTAKEIFKTINVPSHLSENVYLPSEKTSSYYIKQFRYHRLNSALNIPQSPDSAIPQASKAEHQGVVNTARKVVLLANIWGAAWKNEPLPAEEFINLIKPAVQFYEYSHLSGSSRSFRDAFMAFSETYMEIVVRVAEAHGSDCLNALQKLLSDSFADQKKAQAWSPWMRRNIAELFYECGLYEDDFVEVLSDLDDEEPMLSPEGELREFLEACSERARDWYDLGQIDRSYDYLKRMIDASFGVAHEKDTQINEWSNVFSDILEENADIVADDFEKISNGIFTNAKFNRARYSSEGAIRLLSSVALHNANCAQNLKDFFWKNDVLEFPSTVEALIAAAIKDESTSLVVAVALYRRLYLPYERYTNLDPIKLLSEKLCSLEDREEAVSLLRHLKNSINQDVSEHTRGAWWSSFMEVFESVPNQEDLLNEIRPCIEKQKPKIDYTPGSITLQDGTKIEEDELIEQAKSPDRLIEILKNLGSDGFYRWNKLIKPASHKLGESKIKEALDILLEKEKHGRDLVDLIEQLITIGEVSAAEKYALKALSKSASHGWTRHYDGGSRLVPYEILTKIDAKYRKQALNNFIEDFLQGYRPRHIAHELENFLHVFWETLPHGELWPEIREHVLQLREFSVPAIELSESVSLGEVGHLSISLVATNLLFESLEMPYIELREDALKGITYLYEEVPNLREYIEEKIHLYLSGDLEKPLLGLAVIRSVYSAGNEERLECFREKLYALLANVNMSVRLFSKDILKLFGEDPSIRFEKELPNAYRIILPEFETNEHTLPSSVLNPGAVLPNTNDPLQLVGIALEALELINHKTGIPIRNLAERCSLLMKQLMPIEDWNSNAERDMQSEARGLRIETLYRRPRGLVSFLALGHVISELYDAGVIDDDLLYLLRPALLNYDSKIATLEPTAETLSPVKITLNRDLYRESEWIDVEPELSTAPLESDNGAIILGYVTEAEIPSWEVPNELHIGSICHKDLDRSEIEEDPEHMIPGRMMSAWWQADQYPGIPYLQTALESSLLVRATIKQRAEFGSVPWLALNPIVADNLGWSFDESGLFRWINDDGLLMVESKWWHSGRLGRFPHADGVRASGWFVYATKEGYQILKGAIKGSLWGAATSKKFGRRHYEPQQKIWCSFSVIE